MSSPYDHVHRARRRAALAALRPGDRCYLCGRLLLPGQRLQLDHLTPVRLGWSPSNPSGGPAVVVHGSCNERRGARFGNRLRGLMRAYERARREGQEW